MDFAGVERRLLREQPRRWRSKGKHTICTGPPPPHFPSPESLPSILLSVPPSPYLHNLKCSSRPCLTRLALPDLIEWPPLPPRPIPWLLLLLKRSLTS